MEMMKYNEKRKGRTKKRRQKEERGEEEVCCLTVVDDAVLQQSLAQVHPLIRLTDLPALNQPGHKLTVDTQHNLT